MNLFAKCLTAALSLTLAQFSFAKPINGEWTTVSGKVTSVSPDQFILKSTENNIIIEMDDYDWDADGYKLVKGDRVIVRGKVDNDLFEKRSLEANTVYVKNLDAFFYASPLDEEGAPVVTANLFMANSLPDGASVEAQGIVTKKMDEEFIINTGLRKLIVEVDELSFNPLDKKGLVKVEKGDMVRVFGEIDDDFLEGKELQARYLVNLN